MKGNAEWVRETIANCQSTRISVRQKRAFFSLKFRPFGRLKCSPFCKPTSRVPEWVRKRKMECHCLWKMCAVLIGLSGEHLPYRSLNDRPELQLNLRIYYVETFTISRGSQSEYFDSLSLHSSLPTPYPPWPAARVSYFQSLSRIPLSAILTERHPFHEIYCFILCINFITLASFVISRPFSDSI